MKDPVPIIISSFCLSFIAKCTNLYFLMRIIRLNEKYLIMASTVVCTVIEVVAEKNPEKIKALKDISKAEARIQAAKN